MDNCEKNFAWLEIWMGGLARLIFAYGGSLMWSFLFSFMFYLTCDIVNQLTTNLKLQVPCRGVHRWKRWSGSLAAMKKPLHGVKYVLVFAEGGCDRERYSTQWEKQKKTGPYWLSLKKIKLLYRLANLARLMASRTKL